MDEREFDDFYTASFQRITGQVYAISRAVSRISAASTTPPPPELLARPGEQRRRSWQGTAPGGAARTRIPARAHAID